MRFGWLGSGKIPASLDLRRRGWILDKRQEPSASCVGLIDVGALDNLGQMQALCPYARESRSFVLVIGIHQPHERATLLQAGFGDAVDHAIALEELEARAGRIVEFARWLPRLRDFGHLQLDLLAREAYCRGKPLNLNPREFALLWRLADSPNQTVSKRMLFHDVWRMGFVPVTNSIAVHMSRLRRKLGFVGLEGIIETASEGGYCLRLLEERRENGFALPPHAIPAIGPQPHPARNGITVRI